MRHTTLGAGSRLDSQIISMTKKVSTAIIPEVCRTEMATSYLVSLICGIRSREFPLDFTEDMKTFPGY